MARFELGWKWMGVGIGLFSLLLAATAPAEPLGRISGTVVDPEGTPLSGIKLILTQGERFKSATISGPGGRFEFLGVPAGSYSLKTEKAGFETVTEEIRLEPGGDMLLEVTLQPSARLTIHERVMVIGDAVNVDEVPGSAHYLGEDELRPRKTGYDDIHELLRSVPGLNFQDEEGYGLRPNIGMRGSGSERSSKIAVMEDGVPIAPAPYAAPAAYYFPVAGRMEAIEVRKGSSQIKHGPQTTGGALNLVSTRIPNAFGIQANSSFGEDSTGKLHFNVGDSRRNLGWLVETYQINTSGFKELDGGGDTGFEIQDYLAKLRFNTGSTASVYQELELKAGSTGQDSRETYLGLTDADFRANPLRRYRGSQVDEFNSDHQHYMARHFIAPRSNLDVTTTFYRNDFQRNWYKLQSVNGVSLPDLFGPGAAHVDELDIVRGADSSPDALKVRANNRTYYSQGIQSVLGWRVNWGEAANQFQFGFRFHRDQEDRFQHEDGYQMEDGRMRLTSRGAPGSQSNRISDAEAWALFVQDKIDLGAWSFTPGLRYENIDLTRTDFSGSDPDRTAPTRVRTNAVEVLIPGIGVSYQFNARLNLFGGVHKGFAPPGPGSNEETRSEESLNYELGLRWRNRLLNLHVAGFFNDYSNLLGADTLASGGTGEGELFNGGRSRVTGLEFSAAVRLDEALDTSYRLPLRVAYTLTDGEFLSSFDSEFEPWGNVNSGDQIPYLPRHQLFASLGLERGLWRVNTDMIYESRMRTVAGQGPLLPLQSTDSRVVWNVSGEYDLQGLSGDTWKTSVYLSVRNLGNEEYIVARRPAGARPGLPRTVLGGLRFRLGR